MRTPSLLLLFTAVCLAPGFDAQGANNQKRVCERLLARAPVSVDVLVLLLGNP